jgi:hypothetical protein
VDHAVAIEGVIRLFAEDMNRIGADTQKVSLEVFRDSADHFHIIGVSLFGDRTEITVQEKVGGGCVCLNQCHERGPF